MGRFSGWPSVAHSLNELPAPFDDELRAQLDPNEQPATLVYVAADPTAARHGPWARTRGVAILALTNQRLLFGIEAGASDEPRWMSHRLGPIIRPTAPCLHGTMTAYVNPSSLVYGARNE